MISAFRRFPALVGAVVMAACAVSAGCSATVAPPAPVAVAASSFLTGVKSMAALGDSITRGVNACGRAAQCPAASWSTGSDESIDSLASRIAQFAGTAPQVFNDAVAGAKASGLSTQVQQAVKQRPGLVTLLIGSNDACASTVSSMTSVAAFTGSVGQALSTLSRQLPDTYVLVASVPDLPRLQSISNTVPTALTVWASSRACGAVLPRRGETAAAATGRLAAVETRLLAYNGALEQACGQSRRCFYDGGAVHRTAFGPGDISTVDYFHPSASGQHILAATAWKTLQGFADRCRSASGC